MLKVVVLQAPIPRNDVGYVLKVFLCWDESTSLIAYAAGGSTWQVSQLQPRRNAGMAPRP